MTQRASEEQFARLHNLVTNELINRVEQGSEASTQDIKAAIEWLAKNNITGVALSGSPLGNLLAGLGELDQEDVERAIR
jgi:hypothetical protein